MPYTPHGKHLIAGEAIGADKTFTSTPVAGDAHAFACGSPALVDRAVTAAEDAFWSYGYTDAETRAVFLETIADEIESRADDITEMGTAETALPTARLQGERGRTTGQLRMFADHIRKGDYLDRRHDPALPDRAPAPRPDLKLVQRPLGPVAVFGASNFALAFSTAGGDTASALAAGCPVIVKGHEAHPATAELVAEAITAAVAKCGLHPGTFSMIHGGSHEVGKALVEHPLIRAAGFTGSLRGGRALYDLCAARPEPIPFYGELGSINPMFMMPAAMAARAAKLGAGWAGSLTMGVGQFCTNPGVAVVLDGAEADAFTGAAAEALNAVDGQTMLTDGIADAYRAGRDAVAATGAASEVLSKGCDGRHAAPALFVTSGDCWLATPDLAHEVFGPLGIVIRVKDEAQMQEIARGLSGQLTCTLHMDDADTDAARALVPVLERKAGRLLVNGFPTGVEVCDAMVHGGPYPATTFAGTSVGTMAIRRFLRPVSYQDFPAALLPKELA
ncbi:aldehyde dehydrogenase (NADP(+)) [Psychromarinibacter halotolerans]|uniref:Aldehyde dehydrogenase (NADP(+)) n=1 Tax=Psychromarinibacter halotolerans TaxID=1775175 RepID=A0ABV7GRN8_9RHOB|nr:aldehyde dehydrogenase (NADP(+)) [Psychromarinibacter halotolerans]MDF0597386.1 aldehyde dehydrogenase (NADP(+)) [Psychromarinibacter halotolerans]